MWANLLHVTFVFGSRQASFSQVLLCKRSGNHTQKRHERPKNSSQQGALFPKPLSPQLFAPVVCDIFLFAELGAVCCVNMMANLMKKHTA